MKSEPSLSDVIREALEARLSRLHVCLPGQVKAYDPTTCTADVQPCLQDTFISDEGEASLVLPVLPNVPVAFPRVGNAVLTFPLAAGDYVRLVFSERSLYKFKISGGVVDPVHLRKHDLSDAIADVCGVWPTSEAVAAHASNIVLGFTDGGAQLHLKPNGEVSLGAETPTNFVAMANKVLDELTLVKTALQTIGAVGTATDPTTTTSMVTAFQTGVAAMVLAGFPHSVASLKVRTE